MTETLNRRSVLFTATAAVASLAAHAAPAGANVLGIGRKLDLADVGGHIARPAYIEATAQPYTFRQVATASQISDALRLHRVVYLAAGTHVLDQPIQCPSDQRSFDWDDPGGRSYALIGPGSSHTTLHSEHAGNIITQSGGAEHGIFMAPRISGMTVLGNEITETALVLSGWRKGVLEDVIVRRVPNGTACHLDATTVGGGWYNTVRSCLFGDFRNDMTLWCKYGLRLSGWAGRSGKANENSIVETQFINCWAWGLGLTGVGEFDRAHSGIRGGAAMNHSQGCTFYAQRALFRWDDEGKPLHKPYGIYHDSNGGHISTGDYFERLYTPLRQTQIVSDHRFHIPYTTIKNSGHFIPGDPKPKNRNPTECYREGGGPFQLAGDSFNVWTGRPVRTEL